MPVVSFGKDLPHYVDFTSTDFTYGRFLVNIAHGDGGGLLFAATRKLGVSETIPLTTVFLITAIRAVRHAVTLPGPRDALTVPTLKLKRCT